MSAHYSKFGLNTYLGTPYFQAHLPEGYPIRETLENSRAFRRLPSNLRELSALAKQWWEKNKDQDSEIGRWYDTDGYELNPHTEQRLTDEEIDADWVRWQIPPIHIRDIPIPVGGFPDPDIWQPPKVKEITDDGPSWEDLARDVEAGGYERVSKDYGIPIDELHELMGDTATFTPPS